MALNQSALLELLEAMRSADGGDLMRRLLATILQLLVDAEATAVIGAELHLPSGQFNANGAWLVLAAIAFNLTRAAGTLASRFHAKATTATIRHQLINVPARPVRTARRIHLRLPTSWPWADAWLDLFAAALGPPTATPT